MTEVLCGDRSKGGRAAMQALEPIDVEAVEVEGESEAP
jgi:hypothetical protein